VAGGNRLRRWVVEGVVERTILYVAVVEGATFLDEGVRGGNFVGIGGMVVECLDSKGELLLIGVGTCLR
jgi:hypothetical protein